MDGYGGDRPRRSGAGDHAVVVGAAPVARLGVVHGPFTVGVEKSVRRSRGEEDLIVIPSISEGSTLQQSWAGHEARTLDPSSLALLGMTHVRNIEWRRKPGDRAD